MPRTAKQQMIPQGFVDDLENLCDFLEFELGISAVDGRFDVGAFRDWITSTRGGKP